MLGKVFYVTHGDPEEKEVIALQEVSRFILGIDFGYFSGYSEIDTQMILKESTEC